MEIELHKNNGEKPDGIIVVYGNHIVHSIRNSFEDLIKNLCSHHKLKSSDVFSNAAQLLYYKTNNKIIVTEDRKIDLFRLAQKPGILKRIKESF